MNEQLIEYCGYAAIVLLVILCIVVIVRPTWLGLSQVKKSSSDDMVAGSRLSAIDEFTEHSSGMRTTRKVTLAELGAATANGIHLVLFAMPRCEFSEKMLIDMLGMQDIGFTSVLVVSEVHRVSSLIGTPLLHPYRVEVPRGYPYMLGVKDGVGFRSLVGAGTPATSLQTMYHEVEAASLNPSPAPAPEPQPAPLKPTPSEPQPAPPAPLGPAPGPPSAPTVMR